MRALAPSRQDPDGLCGTPGIPGPVQIPPDLARIWAGEVELLRTTVSVESAQGAGRETPPALPFILGPAAVVGTMLVVTAWRRVRRSGVADAPISGEPEPEIGAEPAADAPPTAETDEEQTSGADVIPIRSRHRRRKGEEKPAKPIVVPLGGRRPSAPPITVRLPSHTASLLSRPTTPAVKEEPVAEEPEDANAPPATEKDRSGRSWWVMD